MGEFNLWCGLVQRYQWDYYVSALWVPYRKHYLVRDISFPLVWSAVLCPAQGGGHIDDGMSVNKQGVCGLRGSVVS